MSKKNSHGPTEKTELSLDSIRQIMHPCPLKIVPREVQVDDSKEFTGRNTDAARRKFHEETGKDL